MLTVRAMGLLRHRTVKKVRHTGCDLPSADNGHKIVRRYGAQEVTYKIWRTDA